MDVKDPVSPEPQGVGEVKVLLCAMNESGSVAASIRVDPVEDQVEAARNVLLATSPIVKECLVHKKKRGSQS